MSQCQRYQAMTASKACNLSEQTLIPDAGLSEPACHLSAWFAAPVLAAAPVAPAAGLTAEMHGLAVAAAGGLQASWLCAAPWKYATPSTLPACAAGTLFSASQLCVSPPPVRCRCTTAGHDKLLVHSVEHIKWCPHCHNLLLLHATKMLRWSHNKTTVCIDAELLFLCCMSRKSLLRDLSQTRHASAWMTRGF